MADNIIWQPNQGVQTEFHTREEFEVFYGGAAGGGKTQSLLMEGLRQVHNGNYKAILFRRTFPELQEHIDRSRQLFPLMDPGAKWNEQKKRWVFPSGAVYRFGHLKNEGDEFQYQTDEYQYIAFDELTHFTERQYMYLHTRCRSSDPSLRCYIRAASNPGNVGHLWVKERFIDPAPPFTPIPTDYNIGDGNIITLERCFIPAKIADNPYIMRNDPGYVARIMSNPDPIMRDMLLEGDWDVFQGQAFPEWDKDKHIVEPFEIPEGWERFRAYDYGKEAPFCMLFFAVDQDGNVYVYRELYEAGVEATEQARMIHAASGEEMYYITLADPSIWSSVGIRVHISPTKSGESIGEIFALLGISMIPGDNDRLSGKAQVHRFLSSGKLKIFKNCHNLIRTLPTLPRSETRIEDVDTKAEDHCLAGDTLVDTAKGQVPIKELVGTQGYVLTINGLWTKYYDCRKTRKDQELVKVSFEDGRSIVCTRDHRIMKTDGFWVKAIDSKGEECYNSITQSINKKETLCESKSSAQLSRNLTAKDTIFVDNIFKRRVSVYTEQFGSFTEGRYLKIIISIIKMGTEPITKLRTWMSAPVKNICRSIVKTMTIPTGLRPCAMGLLNGTRAMKGELGTKSITRNIPGSYGKKKEMLFANGVAKNIRLKRKAKQDFVQIIAGRRGEEQQDKITKNIFVRFVGKNILRINTNRKKLVQDFAELNLESAKNRVKVTSIEKAGRGDVYCLVADKTHAFSICGGIIVSNCYDALRYGLMSRPMPGVDPNAIAGDRKELTIHQKCMATIQRKRRSKDELDEDLGEEF